MDTNTYEIIIFNGLTGKTVFKATLNCTEEKAAEKAENMRLAYVLKLNCFCDSFVRKIDFTDIVTDKNIVSTINTDNNGLAVLRFYQDTGLVYEKIYNSFSSAKKAETSLMHKFC